MSTLQELIVETKMCEHCSSQFKITDKDLEFYEKVSPVFGGRKYTIPTPTLCPDCRQQRRLSFRNERKLYKRICDATGKPIISIYSPDKPYKVYNQDFWWSGKWNPLDYGKSFDFSRGFFEQFSELIRSVPKMSLNQKKENPNSEYCNIITGVKNGYLSFAGAYSTNIYYSNWFGYINNGMDISYSTNSDFLYQCVDVGNCYNCSYLINSDNCGDSHYLTNSQNCKKCLFCVGLHSKECYLLNKKIDENLFTKIVIDIQDPIKLLQYIDEFSTLLSKTYKKSLEINNSENVIGNHIKNSNNIQYGFDIYGLNNGKYVFDGWGGEDLYDFYEFFDDCKSSYEGQEMGNTYHSLFCNYCYGVNNIHYCFNCYHSSFLFACAGLKNKSYCVFNKQYTKEEYEKLVPKIIEHMQKTGEWGEFFPSALSPFGYNETVAEEYFPLTKEEALKQWFNWSDYEAPFPKVDKIIPASKLPENIGDIPDDILNWAIECEITKKPFRIIKEELEFYRKHNLPIPRRHPDQRHLDRMKLRNPRKLFERKCDKCGKDMKTTYAPERKEIVYCEECYSKEIY